ncbi:MAG TPA: FtsX-like permease family protein [Anaerolineales bacterium]|nr:FtsX-like permease family protein [Anaerolineales bacterium]
MIASRWKKVWADFWGNKTRTTLTILTIAIGTLAVGFNSNMGLYMNESMDSDYLSANPSEAQVFAAPLDDEMVEMARHVPGVNAVEGFSVISARIVRTDGKFVDIQFTALEDPSKLKVNMLKPVQGGSDVPKYGNKETILDNAAASLGYKPGDSILIELDNGRHRELKLAGYIHDVTGFPYNLTNRVNAYVTPETMEWLGGSSIYNALAVSVAENPTDQDHVTEVAQAVADRMKRAGATVNFVSVYQPGHHFAYSVTQGVFFVLGVLGYLTVILSGFLIVNTITALMTQQTRQVGIMKAIGGGTLQIFGLYIVLIMSFGLAALAIAIPLANLAAQTIGGGMAAWLNFNPSPFHGYTSTYIQQIIVAVVVPLLAAIFPIFNSVRVTVREALSDYGLGGNAKPKIDSVNKNSVLIPRPIRISLRNTFRRKTRLGLTLFTLVLGGAVFIAVYNLWASFDKVIEDIQGYFLADINISFNRSYRFDEVAGIAQSVPGVESVEGWLEYPGTLISDEAEAGTQILFVAPPSDSTLIDPIITEGRWLTTGDENAIVIGNHLLQMFPDLKVGDQLIIETNGKKSPWKIVGFYSITGNVSPPLLYVNYEYISRLINQPGQVYSLRVITSSRDGDFQKRVNDQLQAVYEAHGVQIGSSQLGAEFIESQKSQTDVLVYFMLVMASLIAVVGGLGLMGTMSINVLERTREIGVMRAIGASNGDIQSIVIIEGMVIGLLSWAVAILVAIPITSVLTTGVGLAILTAPMPAVYDMSGIIAWLIFTLVLATIASALPARRASRLTVRDTLAYE